jgi:colanic acid/amylovoran biosynthesis glycosyltransferase
MDEVAINPDDLAFGIHVLSQHEIARAIVADRSAVVLLSLDDWRQSGLSAVCRRSGVASAYISEYSLNTRNRIVDAGTRNPLKRVRRKMWEANEERKRRRAVEEATGLQCNGTPTYDSYRELCPDALLYFDTRVSSELLATAADIYLRFKNLFADGPLRLLYSGRLVAAKGAGQLIEVAKTLREENVDFHLSICGDGDLKPTIVNQICDAQLQQHVTLAGVLDFKSALLPFVKSAVDLFVCCHPQGDPSCTYLETMSCGVPIAGYANEALEGIVRHSGCGWVVPMNQPRALGRKIAEVRRDQESLLAMSLAALAFAREHTFERTFGRRVDHLKHLADVRRSLRAS